MDLLVILGIVAVVVGVVLVLKHRKHDQPAPQANLDALHAALLHAQEKLYQSVPAVTRTPIVAAPVAAVATVAAPATPAANPAPYGRNGYGEPFPSQEVADAYAQAILVRNANLAKAAQAGAGAVATGYVPTWLEMAKFQDTYMNGLGTSDPYQAELLAKVGSQDRLNYYITRFEYAPTTFAGFDPARPHWEGTLKG